jgi:hypothetical protein
MHTRPSSWTLKRCDVMMFLIRVVSQSEEKNPDDDMGHRPQAGGFAEGLATASN